MGIKDVPGIIGRVELKKDSGKPDKAKGLKEEAESSELLQTKDSVEITDVKIAVEKENIIASMTSIEDYNHAKSVLTAVLNDVDERNLLEIHGNADKIKTFLIM